MCKALTQEWRHNVVAAHQVWEVGIVRPLVHHQVAWNGHLQMGDNGWGRGEQCSNSSRHRQKSPGSSRQQRQAAA